MSVYVVVVVVYVVIVRYYSCVVKLLGNSLPHFTTSSLTYTE